MTDAELALGSLRGFYFAFKGDNKNFVDASQFLGFAAILGSQKGECNYFE